MRKFTLRLPDALHKRAEEYVAAQKANDPGFSLNSLIVAALTAFLGRKGRAKKEGEQ